MPIFEKYILIADILDCTFCEKSKAIYHCHECMDFYCEPCDKTAHSHKKRKHHIRAVLSLYDIPQAAVICTHAVVFFYHLRNLQRMCRNTIKRYFDTKTLCHFYFNPVYGDVSWRKPYCLRQEELLPFLTPDEAACRMQGLYRMRKAREKMRTEMVTQFQKIFDRTSGRFYFAFSGPSELIGRQSWYPPKILRLRGIYGTVPLIYTDDVAALVIQRKWRAVLLRQFLKTLVRVTYERQWDPVRGDWKYVNIDDATELIYKPLTLRGDLWDPNEIPEWTVHDVSACLCMHISAGLSLVCMLMPRLLRSGERLHPQTWLQAICRQHPSLQG